MKAYIQVKQLGKRKCCIEKLPVDFSVPPTNVQELIASIVSWQVSEYNERLLQSEMLKYLTREEMEDKAAAGKVVKVGGDQLLANLIVVVAAGLVGVESRGSGVVEVDGRDDADFPVLLVLELLGNGLIGSGAGLVHVDGAGIGLVSGGDGRGGGGGVGAEAVGVVSNSGAYRLKIHKVEVLRAIQLGALVVVQAGLGLPVVLVLQSTQIVRSGLDLGIAHTVADEQELSLIHI